MKAFVPRSPLRRRAAGLACLALAALPHHWLEAQMLRHMLLQLPLIALAGCLLAGRSRVLQRARACDEHGINGLTALLFVSAYWMIPRALEASIDHIGPELAKFASLLLLGALLPGSFRRAGTMVQLFFLGNFCWMTAIAGIQYQALPQRLCNAYLLDDQQLTGVMLVVASVAVAILWCARHTPALLSSPNEGPADGPAGKARG
jgi:hypothetical protein